MKAISNSVLVGILVVLLLLGPVSLIQAGGCAVPVRTVVSKSYVSSGYSSYSVPYVAPVVNYNPYAFFAVPFYVPTYNAVYAAGYVAPAPAAAPAPSHAPAKDQQGELILEGFRSIKEQLKSMNDRMEVTASRLDRIERTLTMPPTLPQLPARQLPPQERMPPPDGQAAQPSGAFLAQLNQHCASCHDSKVAKQSGGDFVLVQGGQIANLGPDAVGNVIKKVLDGSMPKVPRGAAPKLSSEQKLAFLQSMTN